MCSGSIPRQVLAIKGGVWLRRSIEDIGASSCLMNAQLFGRVLICVMGMSI